MPAPHYVMLFASFLYWVYIDKFVFSNDGHEMYQTSAQCTEQLVGGGGIVSRYFLEVINLGSL